MSKRRKFSPYFVNNTRKNFDHTMNRFYDMLEEDTYYEETVHFEAIIISGKLTGDTTTNIVDVGTSLLKGRNVFEYKIRFIRNFQEFNNVADPFEATDINEQYTLLDLHPTAIYEVDNVSSFLRTPAADDVVEVVKMGPGFYRITKILKAADGGGGLVNGVMGAGGSLLHNVYGLAQNLSGYHPAAQAGARGGRSGRSPDRSKQANRSAPIASRLFKVGNVSFVEEPYLRACDRAVKYYNDSRTLEGLSKEARKQKAKEGEPDHRFDSDSSTPFGNWLLNNMYIPAALLVHLGNPMFSKYSEHISSNGKATGKILRGGYKESVRLPQHKDIKWRDLSQDDKNHYFKQLAIRLGNDRYHEYRKKNGRMRRGPSLYAWSSYFTQMCFYQDPNFNYRSNWYGYNFRQALHNRNRALNQRSKFSGEARYVAFKLNEAPVNLSDQIMNSNDRSIQTPDGVYNYIVSQKNNWMPAHQKIVVAINPTTKTFDTCGGNESAKTGYDVGYKMDENGYFPVGSKRGNGATFLWIIKRVRVATAAEIAAGAATQPAQSPPSQNSEQPAADNADSSTPNADSNTTPGTDGGVGFAGDGGSIPTPE